MNKAIVLAALVAPALAACYPMEQAPLVYASKATVGVGVQAGTTDNPGLELILGYKASDVALVPVAAAKFCRRQAAADCEHDIYAMQIIRGSKVDESSNSSVDLALRNAELEQKSAENYVKTLQGEQTVLLATQDKVIARDNLSNILRASPTAETEDGGTDPEREKMEAEYATLRLQQLPAAATVAAQIDAKKSEIANAARDVDRAKDKVAALNAKLDSDTSGHRGDSLSVYGTFGGNGTGNNTSAGLNGEKVFATGIAAQNLSEFRGATDCLGAVNKLVEALPKDAVEARAKLIADASIICTKAE